MTHLFTFTNIKITTFAAKQATITYNNACLLRLKLGRYKMKKLNILIAGLLTVGSLTAAQATSFSGTNESSVTQLCVTALSGNKAAMNQKIKASGFSKGYVAKHVKCNGKNLLAYVEKYGKNADSMINMIDQRDSKVSITDIAKH